MLKNYLLLSGLFISLFLMINSASAATITNGNFDTDLSGWSTVTNGGSAHWDSGKAVLSTGSDAASFSSVLTQGDDGFFNFGNPLLLGRGDKFFKFNFTFTSLGADAMESGGGSSDNLQLWLYDVNGVGDTQITLIDILSSGSSFSFDLSPFRGRSVAFSFELNDENDGFNSQVALDDIHIEGASVVPLPGSVWLELSGLLGLVAYQRLLNNRKQDGQLVA